MTCPIGNAGRAIGLERRQTAAPCDSQVPFKMVFAGEASQATARQGFNLQLPAISPDIDEWEFPGYGNSCPVGITSRWGGRSGEDEAFQASTLRLSLVGAPSHAKGLSVKLVMVVQRFIESLIDTKGPSKPSKTSLSRICVRSSSASGRGMHVDYDDQEVVILILAQSDRHLDKPSMFSFS